MTTLDKFNISMRILLVGSALWVGSMVFKGDKYLQEALSKINIAQSEIKAAQTNIKDARDSLKVVQLQLENLNKLANETHSTLTLLRVERTAMSEKFDRMIWNSNTILEKQKQTLADIKKHREFLIAEINKMNMEQ